MWSLGSIKFGERESTLHKFLQPFYTGPKDMRMRMSFGGTSLSFCLLIHDPWLCPLVVGLPCTFAIHYHMIPKISKLNKVLSCSLYSLSQLSCLMKIVLYLFDMHHGFFILAWVSSFHKMFIDVFVYDAYFIIATYAF